MRFSFPFVTSLVIFLIKRNEWIKTSNFTMDFKVNLSVLAIFRSDNWVV